MPVAIHLVEVLTLVTLLGILTGFSIVVVVVHRGILLALLLLGPVTQLVGGILYASEQMLVGTLMSILNLTELLGRQQAEEDK